MVCQLVAPGRAADAATLGKGGNGLLSSSAVQMPGSGFAGERGPKPMPRTMNEEQIRDCIDDFRSAARNAMTAGFDAVEFHGTNRYLVDQFTQDTCNNRTDSCGGSIEYRCSFGIEIARACAAEIGRVRVGFSSEPLEFVPGHAYAKYGACVRVSCSEAVAAGTWDICISSEAESTTTRIASRLRALRFFSGSGDTRSWCYLRAAIRQRMCVKRRMRSMGVIRRSVYLGDIFW